ncbi:hypothetical protein OS242_12775 [Tumebacillus sp. DT12]|uniref:Uncharacterized protein n=1 Tax=Tumebacillus lacus TaxID=2995335 RepID=A0ABT3X4E3_9BACL|nr:hypothetical protein [Tumebacillus lacus]MCX7570833.1 hypothetical protein [Tumebacillus lacus]
MKKTILSLALLAAFTMSSNTLIQTAKADNPFGNTYKWSTNESITTKATPTTDPNVTRWVGTTWPFDDVHYTTEIFGNQSPTYSNKWYLQHFHAYSVQSSTCGDRWGLSSVEIIDAGGTPIYGVNGGDRVIGEHVGVNKEAWVTKGNNKVTFYLYHEMKRCDGGTGEYYEGKRWRSNF